MMTLPWTDAEEDFLVENLDKMSFEDMAKRLKRPPNAIRQKIHRMRLTPRKCVMDNPLFALIKGKYNGHPEYFTPTMGFFDRTGIDKNKFWRIYRGEERASAESCKRVAEELGISAVEFMSSMQESLFDNPEFTNDEAI
ncbi:TPA_asm: repressor [Porphyromonas phage phage028a_KCOM2799]|uniref:Repressor n=5 Tax=root TaxID=1 RepID=A0AAT9JNM4_9CAUD|nr:hypothetical protein CS387_02945 [Porphyromonas gingivalis]OWR80784.1 hypothetical protein SJDPG11_03350 [Porphyromonas gingivalis SJD11]